MPLLLGFFYIKNHPIPQDAVDGIFELVSPRISVIVSCLVHGIICPRSSKGRVCREGMLDASRPQPRRHFSSLNGAFALTQIPGKAVLRTAAANKVISTIHPSEECGLQTRKLIRVSWPFDQTHIQTTPLKHRRASGQFKDPREAFSINKWPTPTHTATTPLSPILDSARPQIQSFQQHVLAFTRRLLELIALALDVPTDQFASKHDAHAENFDNFELMHYPPVRPDADESKNVPFRISPHTDWGTLTLLFQQSIGGLEVRPPTYTTPQPDLVGEKWTPAPVYNDMVLINIGDMLEFWTAGRLKSTWHRVVPTTQHGGVDRYTYAYFLHPNKDAVLVPIEAMKRDGWVPRYAGIGRTAEEHIHARIRAAHKLPEDDAKVAATANVSPRAVVA